MTTFFATFFSTILAALKFLRRNFFSFKYNPAGTSLACWAAFLVLLLCSSQVALKQGWINEYTPPVVTEEVEFGELVAMDVKDNMVYSDQCNLTARMEDGSLRSDIESELCDRSHFIIGDTVAVIDVFYDDELRYTEFRIAERQFDPLRYETANN